MLMYITNDKWHCGDKGQHIDILIMRRFTVCVDQPIIDYNMNRYKMNNDM